MSRSAGAACEAAGSMATATTATPRSGAAPGGEPIAEPEALPSWFVVALVAALAALIGFGTIGLALAVAGAFVPLPTLALGLAATVALLVAVAPWRFAAAATRRRRCRPSSPSCSRAVRPPSPSGITRSTCCSIAIPAATWSRRGGWRRTTTSSSTPGSARSRTPNGLQYASAAVFDRGDGHLYFQFSHLLPTLLAEARWLGGNRLMFFTPPILGGLGLLCFYALATRFVRPWIALAAMAALATDLVQMHFMRDSYSELPTQVVLLGGLWLLTRGASRGRRSRASPGLLLGATVMARIDGPLYLVAVPFVVGTAVVAARRGDPSGRAKLIAAAWLTFGVAIAVAIGLVDVRLRSEKYLHDLGSRGCSSTSGLGLACLVAIGIAAWAPRLVTWPVRFARGRLAEAAGLVVGLGLFGAWFVRPHIQTTHDVAHPLIAALQRLDNKPIDATRRYYENSLVWHSWYLGPVALAAGIVGVALLTRGDPRPARPGGARRHGVHSGRRGVPLEREHLSRPDLGDAPVPAARDPRLHPVRVRRRRPHARAASGVGGIRVVVAEGRVASRRGRHRRRGDRVADPHRVAGAGRDDPEGIPRSGRAALPRARARRGGRRAPGRDPAGHPAPDAAQLLQRPRRGAALRSEGAGPRPGGLRTPRRATGSATVVRCSSSPTAPRASITSCRD